MILKNSVSTKLARPGKSKLKVDGNGRDEFNKRNKFDNRGKVGINKVNSNEVKDNKVTKEKNYQKTRKKFRSKKTRKSLDFFISKTRLTFTKLKQVFIKALILH